MNGNDSHLTIQLHFILSAFTASHNATLICCESAAIFRTSGGGKTSTFPPTMNEETVSPGPGKLQYRVRLIISKPCYHLSLSLSLSVSYSLLIIKECHHRRSYLLSRSSIDWPENTHIFRDSLLLLVLNRVHFLSAFLTCIT